MRRVPEVPPAGPSFPPEVEAGLPPVYLQVLRDLAAGADDAVVAEHADVDVAAVPALVRLALAKLDEAQRRHGGG